MARCADQTHLQWARAGRTKFMLVLWAASELSGCGGGTASGGRPLSAAGTAPSIATQPQAASVTAPATATFSVVALGTPPLGYQWSRSGQAILGATSSAYTTAPTMSTDNGATFSVMVRNASGSVASETAALSVTTLNPPTTGGILPGPVSVTAGLAVSFSVSATGALPLTYAWTRNGAALPSSNAATLSFAAASTADDGATFAVTISNAAGSVTTAPVTLSVTPAMDVTTYHNDSMRSGLNASERTLRTSTVAAATFGVLMKVPLDGKVDAQPLVLAALPVNGTIRNVVYVATEHDTVYALDSTSGATLWTRSLLPPGETPSVFPGCDEVVPEIGITATPVIDRPRGRIYLVAMSTDGTGTNFQRLHALDITTGADVTGSPVAISGSVASTGAPFAPGGMISFAPGQYKERSALLLDHGTVYLSFAAHCDVPNYTGWIFAYDADTLGQSLIFNDEPSATWQSGQGEAAFWNSGSGPSADLAGNIYAMSGNGIFDATLTSAGFPTGNDYGNTIFRLVRVGSTLQVADYFTMYNTTVESAADIDLGSGGLMLLPDLVDGAGATRHLAVGAGKDQNIYVVDREQMGKFTPASNANAYQFYEGAFTHNPGTGCGPLPIESGIYGAPVYFDGNVYFAAAGNVIRSFHLVGARFPGSASTQTALTFCFPGATLSVSADGTAGGILWAVANSQTQGELHAYDARDLSHELYSSASSGTRDQFGPGSKFTPPTVANGRVFVGTQLNRVLNPSAQNYLVVFGLR